MKNDHDRENKSNSRRVPAGEFKARCLKLMDEVQKSGAEIVITKRGKPVARLAPVAAPARQLFGPMAGTAKIVGDVVAPLDVTWEAEDDGEPAR